MQLKKIDRNMESVMKNTRPTRLTLSLLIASTGLLVIASQAVAQEVTEEILVQTPIERTELESSAGTNGTTQLIELNRYVSFADLNLANPTDVDMLDSRIKAIAKDSCQKLSDMFPLERSDMSTMNLCVKRAVASAKKQRQSAIEAAP
jgi:UrcA family protein